MRQPQPPQVVKKQPRSTVLLQLAAGDSPLVLFAEAQLSKPAGLWPDLLLSGSIGLVVSVFIPVGQDIQLSQFVDLFYALFPLLLLQLYYFILVLQSLHFTYFVPNVCDSSVLDISIVSSQVKEILVVSLYGEALILQLNGYVLL